MAWDGQIYQCQLYDRACKVKQCFRCHNYGHIGPQCNATQSCGYCTEQHETKYCRQKGVEGFTPRCAVCKGAHTAWSNACPARRKEMRRIEQAKEVRSIYWHVPLREKTAPQGTDHTRGNARRENHRRTAPVPPQSATERPRETRPTAPETNIRPETTPTEAHMPAEAAVPAQETATQTPAAPSVVEE